MVEGKQCSVLLQAIVTLHRLQQDGNKLRPLPGAIQTSHLGYQHGNLGRYLSENKKGKKKKKNDQRQSVNTAGGRAEGGNFAASATSLNDKVIILYGVNVCVTAVLVILMIVVRSRLQTEKHTLNLCS